MRDMQNLHAMVIGLNREGIDVTITSAFSRRGVPLRSALGG